MGRFIDRKKLLELFDRAPFHLLISGQAGSGKSYLVHEFLKSTKRNVLALAPSGIAALNLGGFTVHSAFNLAPVLKDLRDLPFLSSRLVAVLKAIDTIVLDECSMLRADILDRIDLILRAVRHDPRPFGGVRMIFVGDLFQLPPIVNSYEKPFLRYLYGNHNFEGFYFESRVFLQVLRERTIIPFTLEGSYRQGRDECVFLSILDAVRRGKAEAGHLALLNRNVSSEVAFDTSIYLTTTGDEATVLNDLMMGQLCSGPIFEVQPELYLEAEEHRMVLADHPMNAPFRVRANAKVIFTQNDPHKRWRNGTRGSVTGFEVPDRTEPSVVYVKLESTGEVFAVEKVQFMVEIPVWDTERQTIGTQKVGSIKQFPLLGGYALTIHRSQSLTLERIALCLGFGAFSHGQTYVGLSRVRAFNDITLSTPITTADIIVNTKVAGFQDHLERISITVLP